MDDTTYDYDLFVIGAGSGGIRAARVAASLGARVAVCEERYVGGTCVNAGCIPKKLFSYAAHYGAHLQDARGYGWSVPTPTFDWPTLVAQKDAEISRLDGIYRRMLDGAGVALIEGHGRLVDPHTVAVGDDDYRAAHVLIATGSWPRTPPIAGGEHLVSSNALFHLAELPERVAIVGGGYIACEFAAIFRGLGASVALVHRGELVLSGFDDDVRRHVTSALAAHGVELHLEREASSATREGDGEIILTLDDGACVGADLGVCAIGRAPLTADLGLDAAGVELGPRGGVEVDARFRSSAPSIFAVGDVIDREQLTPVALAQGMRLAHDLFGDDDVDPLSFELVPTAVFTEPEVAAAGLTEREARDRLGDADVRVYRSRFTPLKHQLTGRKTRTLMKIIVRDGDDRVVGVHIAGEDAAEILQGFAAAMMAGATKAQLDATLGIHPTAAEELVTMRTPV